MLLQDINDNNPVIADPITMTSYNTMEDGVTVIGKCASASASITSGVKIATLSLTKKIAESFYFKLIFICLE